MTHHGLRRLAIAAVVCAALWLSATVGHSGALDGPASLPNQVRAALESNAKGLDPTTVVYDMKRTTSLASSQLSSKLHFQGPPSEFVKEQTVRYLWQDGMTYVQTRTTSFVRKHSGPVSLDDYRPAVRAKTAKPKAKSVAPPEALKDPRVKIVEIQETAIDKTNYYNGTGEEPPQMASGKEPKVILSIEPIDLARSKLRGARLVRPEYFHEAGFFLPSKPEEQGRRQASLVLTRLDAEGDRLVAVEQAEIDGTSCLLVATEAKDRRYRFYLDPKLNFAVRRREELSSDGRLLVQSDGSDFKRDGSSETWLPRHHLVTYYRWPVNGQAIDSKPLVHITFDVKELNHDPIPLETFQIKYRKAGTYIADATLPEAKALPSGKVSYRIPANPAQLDAAIKAGMRGENPDRVFRQIIVNRGNRAVPLLLVGNALVVLILVVWLYRRARLNRDTSSGESGMPR